MNSMNQRLRQIAADTPGIVRAAASGHRPVPGHGGAVSSPRSFTSSPGEAASSAERSTSATPSSCSLTSASLKAQMPHERRRRVTRVEGHVATAKPLPQP